MARRLQRRRTRPRTTALACAGFDAGSNTRQAQGARGADQWRFSKQDPKAATGNDSVDVSDSEDELEFLEALDGIYGEQQARLEQQQELEEEKKRAQADLDALRKFGPSDTKPYSFLLLEDLRDELAAEEDHETVNNADLKPAAKLVEAAQSHFDQVERDRRRIQEVVAEKKHPDRQAAAATELKLAQRESQVAKELITVRELEVEVRTLRRDVTTLRKTLLAEKIAVIGRDVRFTRQDVQERLKELTSTETELNAKLKEVRASRRKTELEQAASLKQLKDAKSASAVMDLAAESYHVARRRSADRDVALERVPRRRPPAAPLLGMSLRRRDGHGDARRIDRVARQFAKSAHRTGRPAAVAVAAGRGDASRPGESRAAYAR